MIKILRAYPLPDYKLKLLYNTGQEGIFDMQPLLSNPIFSKLKKPEVFSHVAIDETIGTVFWQNGIDLCPVTTYENTKFD
jgi:hypothetical protein